MLKKKKKKREILALWMTLVRLPVGWVDTEYESSAPLERLTNQNYRRPASCAFTNARPWWVKISILELMWRGHKSLGRRQGYLSRQGGLEQLLLLM